MDWTIFPDEDYYEYAEWTSVDSTLDNYIPSTDGLYATQDDWLDTLMWIKSFPEIKGR